MVYDIHNIIFKIIIYNKLILEAAIHYQAHILIFDIC